MKLKEQKMQKNFIIINTLMERFSVIAHSVDNKASGYLHHIHIVRTI